MPDIFNKYTYEETQQTNKLLEELLEEVRRLNDRVEKLETVIKDEKNPGKEEKNEL